jgi:enterochelin esterase-like enzyme
VTLVVFFFQPKEALIALLKENDIRHKSRATDRHHSWPVWRKCLAEFAPKLFR